MTDKGYTPGLLNGRLKSFVFMAGSICALPASIAICMVTYILSFLLGQHERKPTGKTILVSGGRTTKSLVHARQFHRAGHRVILAEEESHWFCATRYSNCVNKFYTLPDPLKSQSNYTARLVEIVLREKVDLFIPCCGVATTICDGIAKENLEKHCTVLQFDETVGRQLDQKDSFMAACQEVGLEIPKTITVTSAKQVMDYDFSQDKGRKYIMKCIGVDDRTRNDLTQFPYEPRSRMQAHLDRLNISPSNPYILQEFLTGKEYCCQSIAIDGVLRTFSACESSDILMNYRHLVPGYETESARMSSKMLHFAQKFTKAKRLTGPIAFDFISTDGERLLPIEANPRTHTANTNFYGSPEYAMAYTDLTPELNTTHSWPIFPMPESRPTYWIPHEIFNFVFPWLTTKPVGLAEFIMRILTEREAEWDLHDPLPFLALYHWQWFLVFLNQGVINGRRWSRVNASTGKVFWMT